MALKESNAALLTSVSSEDLVFEPKWKDLLRGIVLDRTCGIPLHVQLRTSFRNIISGSLKPGERIPAEESMMKQLHVSRATVRRALSDLTGTGMIERRRALGTIVSHVSPAGPIAQVAVVMPDSESYELSIDASFLGAIDRRRRIVKADLRMLRHKDGESWNSFNQLVPFSPRDGGIIVLGSLTTAVEGLNRLFRARGFSVVNVDCFAEGAPVPSVGVDDEKAVQMGLDYLHQLGHRRITLLVAEPEEFASVRKRASSFEAHSRSLGLPEARVFHCGAHNADNSAEAAIQAMPYIWQGDERPTAIFAVSDHSAFGAMNWFHSRGVSIPRDVSVLSFDGTRLCSMLEPRLSTLVQPFDEIAKIAFHLLTAKLDFPERVVLPPVLREAGTTACCPPMPTR